MSPRSRVPLGVAVAVAALVAAGAGPAAADEAPEPDEDRAVPLPPNGSELDEPWRGSTWDLAADLALGRVVEGSRESTAFMGRVRGGLLVIREPRLWSVGPSVEVSNVEPVTFGLTAQLMHLGSGGWIQVGALADVRPRFGVLGAVGWSIFGFEAQVRADPTHDVTWALYGRLVIPIRLLVLAD